MGPSHPHDAYTHVMARVGEEVVIAALVLPCRVRTEADFERPVRVELLRPELVRGPPGGFRKR